MNFKAENLGNQIKKVRELRNIPLKEMAQYLNMGVQGYGRIERNEVEVSVQKLGKIAEYLQVSLADILGFDEKAIFNNQECQYIGINVSNNSPVDEIKKLYEARITDLQKMTADLITAKDQEICRLQALLEKTFSKN